MQTAIQITAATLATLTGLAMAGPESIRYRLIESGSRIAMHDYTLDNVVTVHDFAVAVYYELVDADLLSKDVDGDGKLTAQDTWEAIAGVVSSSLADAGAADAGIDIDRATNLIFLHFEWARQRVKDRGFERDRRAVADVAENWPDDENHDLKTSGTYPPFEPSGPDQPGHDRHVSRAYPPNHVLSVTRTWGDPDCNDPIIGTSECSWPEDVDRWPANHLVVASDTWDKDRTPVPASNPDQGREQNLGDHDKGTSWQWRRVPGHFYTLSKTWPGDHEDAVSRTWPANHAQGLSKFNESLPHPDNHHQWISQWWTPSVHGQTASGNWPPSHSPDLSNTWGAHVLRWSITWPANHVGTTSSTWPSDMYPDWPPNHTRVASGETERPNPTNPFFPEDHNYFTTFTDLAPIVLPSPLKWPPFVSSDDDDDNTASP